MVETQFRARVWPPEQRAQLRCLLNRLGLPLAPPLPGLARTVGDCEQIKSHWDALVSQCPPTQAD
jgi:hypothetical protein